MAKLSARKKEELDKVGALVPVGGIIAYAPGYFSSSGNGGSWAMSGPSNNTVAAVNSYLNGYWKVCDGTAPNDSSSPIFNSAAKYLPDLTGARFIMGSAVSGTVGGNANNEVTLISGNLPSHTHTMNHDHGSTGSTSLDHNHYARQLSGATTEPNSGGSTGWCAVNAGSNSSNHTTSGPISGGSSTTLNHSHGISAYAGNTGPTGSGSSFSILPKYLSVFYIMRIK